MIIDFHSHSILSDGSLLPTELMRRAENNGYNFLAITDHADSGTIPGILNNLIPSCEEFNKYSADLKVVPGVELTHVKPQSIKDCVRKARDHGAKIVVMHGETLVEPVAPGTNHQAILAGVTILAHPGLLTEDDARLAKERGIFLEITSRKGHCLSNGYIVNLARKVGADLCINSDSHDPGDLYRIDFHKKVALAAGLTDEDYRNIMARLGVLIGEII